MKCLGFGKKEAVMKKIYYIIAAASVMLAASCAKEQVPSLEGNEAQLVKKTFTADFAVETKSSLVDGKKVHWTEGDQISVFDNVNNKNNAFASANITGAGADFTGYTADGATEYVALYPYKFGVSYDAANRKVTASLPCRQKAVNGSFDNNLNIALAVSDGSHLSFKNVCALLKVTIPEGVENVRSLSFVTGTYVSGRVDITLNEDGTFAVAGNTSTNNSFKEVNLDNGGAAMTPGDYYFVVIPGTYNKIYLSVTTTDNELYTRYSNSKLDVMSNDVINLGTVPVDGSKKFRITNLATAPISLEDNWTIGWEIDESYSGKDLTWSNRNTNIISTAPAKVKGAGTTGTAEIIFNKRPGIAILNAVYDGVNYPITFDVRPLYKNHFLTFNKALSSGSTITVGENYLEVTTNASGDGNLSTEDGKLKYWLAPSLAPILCVRLEDPRDMDDVKSANVGLNLFKNFEFNGSGGTFRSTLNGAAKYNLPDGSAVLIWDLREDKVGSNLMPEDFMADGHFRLLVEKITDTAGSRVQKTFKFYGFSSFMSLEDALSHFGITE